MSQQAMKRLVAIFIAAVLVIALMVPMLAAWAGPLVERGSVAADRSTKYDDDIADAEREKERLDREAESLQGDLEDTDAELAAVVIRLKEIEGELVVARTQQDIANQEVERTERELNDLRLRLQDAEDLQEDLEAEIAENRALSDEARGSVGQLARQSYRQGSEASTGNLARLLNNEITQETIAGLTVADRAMRAQRTVIDELAQLDAENRNAEVRLTAVREVIDGLVDEAADKFAEAEEAKEIADQRAASVESLLGEQRAKEAQLEDLQAQLSGQIEENDAERRASENEIANLYQQREADIQDQIRKEEAERKKREEEDRKKREEEQNSGGGSGGGNGGGNNGGGNTSPPPPNNGGVLSYPTAVPFVTSHYGWRLHPVLGYQRLHAGTDFRAYCGVPIYASRDGRVEWARWLGGFGNQVLIDHGVVNGVSLMTSYNHLTSFAVSPGQQVKTGDVVGYSGTTGTSVACHLHFEVYVNGGAVNPMGWL